MTLLDIAAFACACLMAEALTLAAMDNEAAIEYTFGNSLESSKLPLKCNNKSVSAVFANSPVGTVNDVALGAVNT